MIQMEWTCESRGLAGLNASGTTPENCHGFWTTNYTSKAVVIEYRNFGE
jgi:hypothetical protein